MMRAPPMWRKRRRPLRGALIIACRKCHQLSYPSPREDDKDQAAQRTHPRPHGLAWVRSGRVMLAGKPKGYALANLRTPLQRARHLRSYGELRPHPRQPIIIVEDFL